ncbi:hypothetical protein RSAG8_09406, partial [Rhizoctonia solani AG-8 WAC10335]
MRIAMGSYGQLGIDRTDRCRDVRVQIGVGWSWNRHSTRNPLQLVPSPLAHIHSFIYMSSKEGSPPPSTPVWCTGPEQIEVKLVVTGETYNVDVDIAKRMGIIQEGSKSESPFGLKGCSSRDFESALTFCAQDRACAEPPSTELTHIIQETGPPTIVPPSASPEPEPKPAPEASTSTLQTSFANMTLANDDEDDDGGADALLIAVT